jgi:hypothetical protein
MTTSTSQGAADLSLCGLANNGTMEGLKLVVPASAQSPVSGTAHAIADNEFDAVYERSITQRSAP